MNNSTNAYQLSRADAKQLSAFVLAMLPMEFRAKCRVASILYDHRAVVIGIKIAPSRQTEFAPALFSARSKLNGKFKHRIGVKPTASGVFVIVVLSGANPNKPPELVAETVT